MSDANATARSNAPQNRGRILVVDDQRNMRAVTALVLSSEGYTVSQVATGQEALDFLTRNSVDVLLTDLKMEPMDGLTLLKRALEAVPRLQVIIMTAFGSIDSAVEAMRLGAYDYITKPFKDGVLRQRMKLALERARQLSQEKLNLREIAEYCWRNRVRLPFHAADAWADDTFKKPWFRRQSGNHWVTGRECSGWYWFELDVPLSDLQHLERPDGLPARGCDFGKTACEHVTLFGDELCHHKSGLAVIYNGQDASVFDRIRAHFTLQNPGTGALGIRWYPLHDRQWHVSAFVLKHLERDRSLDDTDREQIKRYCISKTGRKAVEQMWRTIYGWPVLCKE